MCHHQKKENESALNKCDLRKVSELTYETFDFYRKCILDNKITITISNFHFSYRDTFKDDVYHEYKHTGELFISYNNNGNDGIFVYDRDNNVIFEITKYPYNKKLRIYQTLDKDRNKMYYSALITFDITNICEKINPKLGGRKTSKKKKSSKKTSRKKKGGKKKGGKKTSKKKENK